MSIILEVPPSSHHLFLLSYPGWSSGDMAVYFDHRIEAPESSDVPSQLTWHSALSVLAVASSSPTTGGNVDLYLQQVNFVISTNIPCMWILPNTAYLTQCAYFFPVHMQGEYVKSCHLERPHQPAVLRWHPTKAVLALGWETGEVVLLTYPSGDQTVLPSTHAACITLLEWSSSGSRLVTGDQVSVLHCIDTLSHFNIQMHS